jgi:hypothetical protein
MRSQPQRPRNEQARQPADATKDFMVTYQLMAGTQELSHWTPNSTSSVDVPENQMPDIVPKFETNLGADSSSGSGTALNTLDQYSPFPSAVQIHPYANSTHISVANADRLASMHGHLPPRSGGPARRRPMRRQNIHASIAKPSIAEVNGSMGMTSGSFGEIAGAKWTGTLYWERNGTWVLVQAVATEMVRNPEPCVVHYFAEFLTHPGPTYM